MATQQQQQQSRPPALSNRTTASCSPRQQHSTAARLASGTPSSPSIVSPTPGLSTSLPPLLDSASPRRELTGATARRTPTSTAAALQATLDHDYPVAQLDAWPLSSRTSYKQPFGGHQQPVSPETAKSASLSLHLNTPHDAAAGSAASPISPRQRKALHRHAVLDESKSTPLLLQELQAFVASELAELARQQHRQQHCQQQQEQPRDANGDNRSTSSRADQIPPWTASTSLQRLQVFREAFQRVIAAFSVYAPVLAQIQDEYDRAIAHLRSQCLEIPTLHAQLQTLQTQCVHELSAHALDAKTRSHALRAQLKTTQGRLAALAAQHAVAQEQNAALQAQIETLGRRSVEMQLSNTSLVHGIKRHDDTLRHIHERSREEGMALTQMASKYHHACEEIAELKKTIATLEEKVGGVHVAADKATIALLTRDLQDTHAKLQTAQRSTSAAAVAELQQSLAQHSAVSHAFVKVLETQGVAVNVHELLGIAKQRLAVACSSSAGALEADTAAPALTVGTGSSPEAIGARDAIASDVLERLAALAQPPYESLQKHTAATMTTTTFLTEPDEGMSLDVATQRLSATDLLVGKGFGADVPEYLQFDGVVRNLHFPRKKLEQILTRVWQQKDDLEKLKRSHLNGASSAASASSGGPAGSSSAVPLVKVFTMMLQRMCPTKAEAIESAYNVVAALERFAPSASDCRLFLAILQGEIPDEARADQLKEIYVVHDALAALEKDRNASSSSAAGGSSSLLPGRIPLADVIQLLRQVFPWKTEHALSALHRALLLDQRGHANVDYAALLLQQDDKRLSGAGGAGASGRSHFVECLRAQYIDDLLAYRRHLQSHIQQRFLLHREGSCGAASSVPAPGALSPSSAGNDASGTAADGSNSATSASPPPLSTSAPAAASGSSTDTSNCDASGYSAMVSIRELRDVLQECDVAKPVQEINRLLATAAALSMDQILTQDAMMVNAQQFVRKLPTLLVKPTGKFHASSHSSAGASPALSAATS